VLQLLQSSQVQAPRARSGIRGLLQATGQRLVQHRATTMWPIAGCSLHTFLQRLPKCGLAAIPSRRDMSHYAVAAR